MQRLKRVEDCCLVAGDVKLDCAPGHIHFRFPGARQVLSSAVLGGGLVSADHLLNMRVAAKSQGDQVSPQEALQKYAADQGWSGQVVGMMTAASMNSLRVVECREQGVDLAVAITAGIDNARCAGDPAEHRLIGQPATEVGTINMVAITSARLSPAALTEAVITLTEAKAAVLAAQEVRSPVSGAIATGTGTDAVAVVNGQGPVEVAYCGKHVRFGELLARAAMNAIVSSLEYYFPQQKVAEPVPVVCDGGSHA